MNQLQKDDFIKIMNFTVNTIIDNESYFCDLDSVAGDGDFGTSLSKGFTEVKNKWEALKTEDIGAFMKSCSMIIMQKCGGASGPIWGKAFLQAGRYAKGKESLDLAETAGFFQSLVDGVQKAGKAKLGDKTLLDSLIPFTESLKESAAKQAGFKEAYKEALNKANEGAESTKKIVASQGRARYLGERSIGAYDAGAKAVVFILSGIYNEFFDQ